MTNIEIILKFTELLLAWPVTALVLGIVFILYFKNEIKTLLKSKKVKVGNVEFDQTLQSEEVEDKTSKDIEQPVNGQYFSDEQISQLGQTINNLENDSTQKNQKINELTALAVQLNERAETFEFLYLNTFLVMNSKIALKHWFKDGSTKDYFMSSYPLPEAIVDKNQELSAIFNVLLVNNLIEQVGEIFRINEKGKKFLEKIGM